MVCVAVVGVLDAGTLAEQRVGLVEKQDPVPALGAVEKRGQVFLRISDVFRDYGRQIDAKDLAAGVFAEQGGGQGLAGAGRAVEQDPVARLDLFRHPQVV